MAEVYWLVGEANVGIERIWPGRHIKQTEWQSNWNNVFPNPYDYISDYECILPHPIRLKQKDRDLWGDLQTAKEQGYGIAIKSMAHFTEPKAADEIVDSGGFKGGLKKINENKNGDPVLESFSWWFPKFGRDAVNMTVQHMKDVLTPCCPSGGDDDIEDISAQFASSDAFFPKSWRHGNVYFKCTIEELCDLYKAFIQDVLEFKVLGTFLYKKEIMHAVLVCGKKNGNDVFANYRSIPKQGNVVTRDDDGNWTWYPQATGTGIKRLHRYYQPFPALPNFRRWEQVAFAFHIPQGYIMAVDNLPGRRDELPMHK